MQEINKQKKYLNSRPGIEGMLKNQKANTIFCSKWLSSWYQELCMFLQGDSKEGIDHQI